MGSRTLDDGADPKAVGAQLCSPYLPCGDGDVGAAGSKQVAEKFLTELEDGVTGAIAGQQAPAGATFLDGMVPVYRPISTGVPLRQRVECSRRLGCFLRGFARYPRERTGK